MKRFVPILVSILVLFVLVVSSASAGNLAKLTITPEKGEAIPALVDVASVLVLFDPPGSSHNQKEALIAEAAPWKHHDIQGLDAPTLEFTSGEPYRLQMDLFFDRYEEGKSVREYTDKIEKLTVTLDGDPLKEELVHQELHRPPTILLTWGTGLFTAVIESCDPPRFTRFLDDAATAKAATSGTPVSAVMTCVFTDFLPADSGKNDGAHKRPGPA
ncbi:MAG: hypothetical protein HYT16_04100 [DPANN group archaeon]|nr:hypothetical protein [DPANN group archaeon]